jgi:hypothetical protein
MRLSKKYRHMCCTEKNTNSIWITVILTDISAENTFNLFLLESSFDDELIVSINGTTAIRNTSQGVETSLSNTVLNP